MVVLKKWRLLIPDSWMFENGVDRESDEAITVPKVGVPVCCMCQGRVSGAFQ
jgi:hypothetical protein